jgi:potassium channel LctB
MKNYIPIDALNSFVKKRKLEVFIDKVSFKQLFTVWFIIILSMGFVYYYSADANNYLAYTKSSSNVNLVDSIYFSFITATSTGYGDVVPIGINKLFSIIEVIFSLGLFAIATSKLIGIKQETILNEIYEISFSEKINRIISSLYLFRIDLNKVMNKIESEKLKKREVTEIWTYFSFFENIISDINVLVGTKKNKDFIKRIDNVDLELLLNGINQSITRIFDTINTLNDSKYEWKRDVTLSVINESLEKTEQLFTNIIKLYKENNNIKLINEEFNKKKEEIIISL